MGFAGEVLNGARHMREAIVLSPPFSHEILGWMGRCLIWHSLGMMWGYMSAHLAPLYD